MRPVTVIAVGALALHMLVVLVLAISIAFPNPFLRARYWLVDRHREPLNSTEIAIPGRVGVLPGLLVANGRRDSVILVCHGRSRSKNYMVPLIDTLSKEFDVLAFDFRGHGSNDYGTMAHGLSEGDDVRRAVEYLGSLGYRDIGIYGVSMGGAAVLKYLSDTEGAATQSPIRGVVLDGTYDTLGGVLDRMTGRLLLPGYVDHISRSIAEWISGFEVNDVKPIDWITGVQIPVLIVHGSEDWLVPVSASWALFDRAGGSKDVHVYSGGHDSPGNAEMQRSVLEFFSKIMPR